MKQLLIILFSIVLFACASPKVLDVSTAPEADFSKYKTYAFYELTAMGDTTKVAAFAQKAVNVMYKQFPAVQ
jgi:hypothetical protein